MQYKAPSSDQPLERMNTPHAHSDTANATRSLAIWTLLIFLALRIAFDVRALLTMHALISEGPGASRLYDLYLSAASLALFRAGVVALAMTLLWRRHQAGLIIAAILFFAELYSAVLRDMTGGVVPSEFGPPATEGGAIARALGRYSMLIAPLVLLAWCSFASHSRRYFRHVL